MKALKVIGTIILFVISTALSAQSEERSNTGFGFQLNQIQNDFGLGINLSNSSLFKNVVDLHLRSNLMFYEFVNEDKMETQWEPYGNVMLGISSVPYRIDGSSVALYGEGGAIAIFASNTFSKQSVAFGGYGLFGFEFYFVDSYCFFLEAGAVGSNAVADKITTKPIYSNGFITAVGWKLKW